MYNIKSNGLRMLTLGRTQLGQAGDQSISRYAHCLIPVRQVIREPGKIDVLNSITLQFPQKAVVG